MNLDTIIAETVGPETHPQRWPWSAAQEAELRRWYGRVNLEALAERVSAVLQRETGAPGAARTGVACQVRAFQYAIAAYKGETDEMCLSEAVAQTEGLICFSLLWRFVRDGSLQTRKEGKQRYISRSEFARWVVDYRELLLAQEEALEATEGQVISKLEGMNLCRLSETHFVRYLKTGVIRAWRVPFGLDQHGFWLVNRKSVLTFCEARASGELRGYLDERKVYVTLRHRLTTEIRTLRRAGRLERRDPLTEPASKYHSGCFTVAQVASHVGLRTEGVYQAIRLERLRAVRVYSGNRWRYAIEPAQARAFATDVAENLDIYKRYLPNHRRQIASAGLLTIADLAKRWDRPLHRVRYYARVGYRGRRLQGRLWGQHLVFEEGDVIEFETAAGLRDAGEQDES